MELKKHPKKDLDRNSGIYFAAGLFLVLILTYVALEWKSFYNHEYDIAQQMEEDLREEVPLVTFITPPPPPPPPVAPPIIEIIENEAEEPESIIQSTESNEETKVIEVDEVEFVQVDEEVNVIWTTIEEVLIFPGCEKENDKRACFQKMINRHISKAFRYPEIAQEMGVEGKVFTQFTINKDGSIGNILLRGPDKYLEKEAQRIISKLPKMKPGKQRERNVKVAFSVPITFKLQ
jgi:protein TonB